MGMWGKMGRNWNAVFQSFLNGNTGVFSSYRPELTIKFLRLCEHCTWYETFGCENADFLSEFSVPGKVSFSFSVPSKVVPELLDSKLYLQSTWYATMRFKLF